MPAEASNANLEEELEELRHLTAGFATSSSSGSAVICGGGSPRGFLVRA
jgi:hypothetical protein